MCRTLHLPMGDFSPSRTYPFTGVSILIDTKEQKSVHGYNSFEVTYHDRMVQGTSSVGLKVVRRKVS